MSVLFKGLCTIFLVSLFIGCGDETETKSNARSGDVVVATPAKPVRIPGGGVLPPCLENGQTAQPDDSEAVYICENGEWRRFTAKDH